SVHGGKNIPGGEGVPIGGSQFDRGLGIDEGEGAGEDIDAGEHPVLPGAQLGTRRGTGGNEDLSGDVSPRGVLVQSEVKRGIDGRSRQHAVASWSRSVVAPSSATGRGPGVWVGVWEPGLCRRARACRARCWARGAGFAVSTRWAGAASRLSGAGSSPRRSSRRRR